MQPEADSNPMEDGSPTAPSSASADSAPSGRMRSERRPCLPGFELTSQQEEGSITSPTHSPRLPDLGAR
jgi:hypothetical protein